MFNVTVNLVPVLAKDFWQIEIEFIYSGENNNINTHTGLT